MPGKYPEVPYMVKVCDSCLNLYNPTGSRQMYCTTCIPDKKARHRYARYGMTEPEFQKLVQKQEGICALCPNPFDDVDHDHKTGKIRGLLCRSCNLKLMGLEDPEWLAKALKYKGGD